MTNTCFDWCEINEFRSLIEFKEFVIWLDSQLKSKVVSEVEVKEYYLGPNSEERWFYCSLSKVVWRLVFPDGPFHGYWGKVE